MSYRDLMMLFGEYTAWAAYARTYAAEAEREEEEWEAYLRAAGSLFVLEREEGEKITDARLRRDTDPKVVEMQTTLLSKRYARKMAVALLENAVSYAAYVSRELTRRTDTAKIEGRVYRGLP